MSLLQVGPLLFGNEETLNAPCGEGSRLERKVHTAYPGGAAQGRINASLCANKPSV